MVDDEFPAVPGVNDEVPVVPVVDDEVPVVPGVNDDVHVVSPVVTVVDSHPKFTDWSQRMRKQRTRQQKTDPPKWWQNKYESDDELFGGEECSRVCVFTSLI